MIFKQWKQVLGLEEPLKTQTRRLVKTGDCIHKGDEQLWYMMRSDPRLGSMVRKGRCQIPTVVLRFRYKPYRIKWQVGRIYAVQPGRGKMAVGNIRLLDIRWEWLQDISVKDVEAEGVGVAPKMPLVMPIQFRLAEFPEEELDRLALHIAHLEYAQLWDSIHTKKGTRWADNPDVWVLSFERV